MTATPIPPSQAAGDTLAAVERYQQHVRKLVDNWMDMELYHAVSGDVEQVRRCCQRLAPLSGPWVALLIAHAELVHGLWRSSQAGSTVTDAQRQKLLAVVDTRVQELRAACAAYVQPRGAQH